MLNRIKIVKIAPLILFSALAILVSGCATAKKAEPVFWPALPDAPRVQYLKSIKDSRDVEDRSSWSVVDLGNKEKKVISLGKPYGIAVKKGKVYVCDTVQADVAIFDLPGKKAATLAGNKGAGKLKKPTSIAVDDDGFIYVTDSARGEVLKYAPDGGYLRAISSGQGMKPTGVAVDDVYIYVVDQAQSCIAVFDRISSEKVRLIGQGIDPNFSPFSPLGIGLDGKGGVYITNLDGRIILYDRDGHPIRKFGKLGTALSEFSRPRSIVCDKDGILYVVDAGGQNVRLFTEKFQLLLMFGEPGGRMSLNVPAGIAVTNENLDYYQQFADPDFVLEKVIFVVSQFGDQPVSLFGVGKKKGIDYDLLLKQRQDEIKQKEEEIRKKIQEEKKAKESAGGALPVEGKSPPAAPAVPVPNAGR